MVQSVATVRFSNVTTDTKNVFYNYKGRKISPVDNNTFFFSGISKNELNDYVDSFYGKLFSEKLISREFSFKLNSFLLRLKAEYEACDSIYDIKRYGEILEMFGVTKGNISFGGEEALSKIGMNYNNYFSHTRIENIIQKYNDNKSIINHNNNIIKYCNNGNANNEKNSSRGLIEYGDLLTNGSLVSRDDARETSSLNSLKESANESKSKDKEGHNYYYEYFTRNKQKQENRCLMRNKSKTIRMRSRDACKAQRGNANRVHSGGVVSIDETELAWLGKQSYGRPYIQWPSMHPRLPFKMRYLDGNGEDGLEEIGGEALERDETKRRYVGELGREYERLKKSGGLLIRDPSGYTKKLKDCISKKSKKDGLGESKLRDNIIPNKCSKLKKQKKLKESRKKRQCNKKSNVCVDKSVSRGSLNAKRGYRTKSNNFLMVCAGSNTGIVGIVPYVGRRDINVSDVLVSQLALRRGISLAKTAIDLSQDVSDFVISQEVLEFIGNQSTETYFWPSGHPLILSKIHRLEGFPLSDEARRNLGGFMHRLGSFLGDNFRGISWRGPSGSNLQSSGGEGQVVRPEPLVSAGFRYAGEDDVVHCDDCYTEVDVNDFSDDDEDYSLGRHRIGCRWRQFLGEAVNEAVNEAVDETLDNVYPDSDSDSDFYSDSYLYSDFTFDFYLGDADFAQRYS